MLEISVLGQLQISLNGEPITNLSTGKVQALLAYLVVENAYPHRREKLAGLLWSEFMDSSARTNLRQSVARLRRIVPAEAILSTRQTVRFDLEFAYSLDLDQFSERLSRYHQQGGITDLRQAVQLYRGDFLDQLWLEDSPAFEEWVLLKREWLRREMIDALHQLASEALAHQHFDEAIQFARQQLEIDWLNELAYQQLMQGLVGVGRRAEALQQFERCRQVLWAELQSTPSSSTVALADQIRSSDDSTPPNTLYEHSQSIAVHKFITPFTDLQTRVPTVPRHNLPLQTTDFVGRKTELAALNRLLSGRATRLVTILATGGMGKTRLALEAAQQFYEVHQIDVYFVELASINTGESMVSAVADAVDYPFQQDERPPKQQLLNYVHDKHLLLVLDNFEHLVAEVEFVNEILRTAPDVKILVTSRERLQISAELIFRLDNIAFPTQTKLEGIREYDAIRLFLQCAQRANVDFILDDDDLTDVAQICRMVQGLPLGIVLAAAWVDLLSPAEIAQEISRSIDFLASELRDVPDRQRSVRAVFEHTWKRLSDAERLVFMKLSVFRGGFTREAAQSVSGASLRALGALVNKALLQNQRNGRFSIHELLRQYAKVALTETGQLFATNEAHCFYFARFLQDCEADLKGHRQQTAIAEIRADFDNIQTAWDWAVEQTLLEPLDQASNSLGFIYKWLGHYQEGQMAFLRAAEKLHSVETSQGQSTLVKILIRLADFALTVDMRDQAQKALSEALDIVGGLERTGENTLVEHAAILKGLGNVAYYDVSLHDAIQFYRQSLALYEALNDRWGEAIVRMQLQLARIDLTDSGNIDQHLARITSAKDQIQKSLTIFQELGDRTNQAGCLESLGLMHLILGQAIEAQSVLEQCIAICRDLGYTKNSTFIEANGRLGIAKESLGLYDQMKAQGQTTLALAREVGYSLGIHLGLYLTGCAALAQGVHQEAEKLLREDVTFSRKIKYSLPFALSCLGYATYKLGNEAKAVKQIIEVLQIVLEIRTTREPQTVILLAALVIANRGNIELAVELKALIWCFPGTANSRWYQDMAGKQITALSETLPRDVLEAAQMRGQSRDLWETAKELLALFSKA